MPKVPLTELNKELLCTGCGWHGFLGATIGPNQERSFFLETDKNKKDHLYWIVAHNYYCPDCFNEESRKGVIVKRTIDGQGKVTDEWLERVQGMDEATMLAIREKLSGLKFMK